MEALSKIISMILVAILIFLFPLQYLFGHQLLLIDDYVEDEVVSLVDDIRENQCLDVKMYEEFLEKLNYTGNLYDIEIEHAVPKESNKIKAIEDIPGVLVASSNLTSLPDINEGGIFPLATHTHTDACYVGHNHIASGCVNGYICPCGVPLLVIEVRPDLGYHQYRFECSKCRKWVAIIQYYQPEATHFIYSVYTLLKSKTSGAYEGVIMAEYDEYTVSGKSYGDIAARNTYRYLQSISYQQRQLLTDYKTLYTTLPILIAPTPWYLSSNYEDALFMCPYVNDITPVCNQVVTAITATQPMQTVNLDEPIDSTVTATYLDGHTGTITCTNNFNPDLVGTQNVTLTYSGRVGSAKTTGTRTCSVEVTVMESNKPVSLTVTPMQQFIERYKNPIFTVQANYEDNTTKTVMGYLVSGYDKNMIGEQTITIGYTEGTITIFATATVTVTPMKRLCLECGNEYFTDENDFDQGCPICKASVSFIQVSPEYVTVNRNEPLNIVVTANYLDGHTETITDWISNFDASQLGYQMVTISYQDKFTYVGVTVLDVKICPICGAKYGLNPEGTDPGCPACKESLVSISASPTNQTVNQGDDMELTVTGLYRDGQMGTILDWSSNYDKDTSGEQIVTVYYRNLSCSVNVMVVSENVIQCPICGTYYNFRDYPWGCPICADTLVGIEAVLLNGGIKVPYGRELDLRVVLIYRDEHREMVFDGWTDSFDAFTLGVQPVTISYIDRLGNTISCLLNVEVVDKLTETVCENGHVYYSDDSLPGCPYCTTLSGDLVEQYYKCRYTDEILDKLYSDGIYNFAAGEYVTIKVTMKTEGSIYSFGLFRKREKLIPISSYGGEVE